MSCNALKDPLTFIALCDIVGLCDIRSICQREARHHPENVAKRRYTLDS